MFIISHICDTAKCSLNPRIWQNKTNSAVAENRWWWWWWW